MATDLHLRLNHKGALTGFFSGREPTISIAAPSELKKTKAGRLVEPPAGVWSTIGGYSSGDVDVVQVRDWLRKCLGDPILKVLGSFYPARPKEPGEHLRIVISSDDESVLQMMNTPWEVMGSPNGAMTYGEPLGVVRVLNPEAPQPEPVSAGDRIKVAIIWANPYGDISNLTKHLGEIQKIADDRPLELSVVDILEFESIPTVRSALGNKFPHVVYYIGHAIQREQRKVVLPIGKPGSEAECSVADFRNLMEEIGPPQLLLLNACATTVGHTLNPYLGAALGSAEVIKVVITMQTEMPTEAGKLFANGFFEELAKGRSISESVKGGRLDISAQLLRDSDLPAFSPHIPVLLQQTLQDNLFTIDITGRELRYLLLKLKRDIPAVLTYLRRKHDRELAELFDPSVAQPRIKLITGPGSSGKSVSVGRGMMSLLSEERYRRGDRYLYYVAAPESLPIDDVDSQIRELFKAFADGFSRLTGSLKRQLEDSYKTRPEESMMRIASWLEEEERIGHRYYICLDNLPARLASEIATRAANLITAYGYLVLISDDAEVAPDLPIKALEVSPMDMNEIRDALGEQGSTVKSDQEIARLIETTGGFPFFVAGYLRRQEHPPTGSDEQGRARYFIEKRQPPLTAAEEDVLRFTALCSIPVPRGSLDTETFAMEAVEALIEDRLLMNFGDGSFQIPNDLRHYFQDSIDENDKASFHELAAKTFRRLAREKQDSQDELTFQLATLWFREAFQHLIAVARLDAFVDDDRANKRLAQARELAEILHTRYLELGNETGAAKSLWEEYRDVSLSLDQYEDRSSDLRYADCLVRLGMYEMAEDLLGQLTQDEVDFVYVNALILHNNLIKERGEHGGFSQRISLLKRAVAGARQLLEKEPDSESGKELLANVEQSLGNALGYGKEAKPDEANGHLEIAEKFFTELKSPLRFRAASEKIEIKRYNSLLTEPERHAAIQTLLENRSKLITRSARYDSIMNSYELGRLETNPNDRANYFRQAFERAGDREPINWHAGINWRRAQIEGSIVTFGEVASDLEKYCERLANWQTRSWSRRKRRNTLLFLSENYVKLGRLDEALAAAEKSWQVTQDIVRLGEGRKDPVKRLEVAYVYGTLALRQGQLDKARAVANRVAAESNTIASLSEAELHNFFINMKRRQLL